MDYCAQKLLESTTHRTLHAHAFSRASTQATLVLTDLLSRYLALLASTSAKYSEHAGRTALSVYDVLGALEEMGTSLEDLSEYVAGEGRELGRYALHTPQRLAELGEMRSLLEKDLRQDRDDSIPLEYAPYDPELDVLSESEEEDDEEEEARVAETNDETQPIMSSPTSLLHKRPLPPSTTTTPPLPLSPISNPPSPLPSPHKRPRTATWSPPDHVPDFLPPFPSSIGGDPGAVPTSASTSAIPIPDSAHPSPRIPTQPLPDDGATDKPAFQVPQTLSTTPAAASTADILLQVPYAQSTLSSLPERHLPGPPPRRSRPGTLPPTNPTLPQLPQIEPSFIHGLHYILTHPPPAHPPPSTVQRHRVAIALLDLIQSHPRWTPADSLYGASAAPCPPRAPTVPPAYPVAVTDLGPDGKPRDGAGAGFKFPQTHTRAVAGVDRMAPVVGQATSRLPELGRQVLHPAILNRSTRLAHPPVLYRGAKPLVYGPGTPAPWNANPVPALDANGVPQTPLTAKPKDTAKGDSDSEPAAKPALPDALLFATWDYDAKDYRVPLPRHRGRMGSMALASGSGSGTITLGRKNSTK